MKEQLAKLNQEDKLQLLTTLLKEVTGINNFDTKALITLNNTEDVEEAVPQLRTFSLKQQVFISAYIKSFGNVAQSCRMSKTSRRMYYYWIKHNDDFANYIDNLEPNEEKLDFLESKLIERVNDKDTTAIIFALKTLGKKRGYIERNEQIVQQTNNIHFYLPDNGRGLDTTIDIEHENVIEIQNGKRTNKDNTESDSESTGNES